MALLIRSDVDRGAPARTLRLDLGRPVAGIGRGDARSHPVELADLVEQGQEVSGVGAQVGHRLGHDDLVLLVDRKLAVVALEEAAAALNDPAVRIDEVAVGRLVRSPVRPGLHPMLRQALLGAKVVRTGRAFERLGLLLALAGSGLVGLAPRIARLLGGALACPLGLLAKSDGPARPRLSLQLGLPPPDAAQPLLTAGRSSSRWPSPKRASSSWSIASSRASSSRTWASRRTSSSPAGASNVKSIRFVKQSYRPEDIRLLRYDRLRAMVTPVLAVAYFAAIYLGKGAKLRLLDQHVVRCSKRFFGPPDSVSKPWLMGSSSSSSGARGGSGPRCSSPEARSSSSPSALEEIGESPQLGGVLRACWSARGRRKTARPAGVTTDQKGAGRERAGSCSRLSPSPRRMGGLAPIGRMADSRGHPRRGSRLPVRRLASPRR